MKLRLFTFPNILTLCNLLSGCAAVIFALCINDLEQAFWCVLVAAVFDFLDGFAEASSTTTGRDWNLTIILTTRKSP